MTDLHNNELEYGDWVYVASVVKGNAVLVKARISTMPMVLQDVELIGVTPADPDGIISTSDDRKQQKGMITLMNQEEVSRCVMFSHKSLYMV